jgi:hypothetical protein
MAKQSALDKVIRQYELELEMHQRAVESTKDIIDRLREQRTVKRAKPRAVKKVDEKAS